jgi:hypothetical protein
MPRGLNAEHQRRLHRDLGEPFRWFKALRCSCYNPADNYYNPDCENGCVDGYLHVEQVVSSAARALVHKSKREIVDEQHGLLPVGTKELSVMPDEAAPGRNDWFIFPEERLCQRAVIQRTAGTLFDTLPHSPIALITDVRQDGMVYVASTHYRLTNNQIEWLGATRPADESNYGIEYFYNPTYTYLGEDRASFLAEEGGYMPQRGALILKH